MQIPRHLMHMLGKMAHRGNSDEGYVFFENEQVISCYGANTSRKAHESQTLTPVENTPESVWFGLGHRQGSTMNNGSGLAIHQPLSDLQKKIWLVFDGEILNAKAIAKELEKEGVGLESESDAELILKGYIHWQERLLSKLEGSFAFLIYDSVEGKIFGARDRFGVKPFYYANEDNFFVFGSELKSMIRLPFISKKISKSAVYDYLVLGIAESNNQTMFRGLSELMPGAAFSILLPSGSMKIWTYFHLITDSKIDRYSRNKVSTLSHRLKKALAGNVSLHLKPGLNTAYRFDGSLESLVFPYILKEYLGELPEKERPKPSDLYTGIFGQVELSEHAEETELKNVSEIVKDLDITLIDSVCNFKDFTDNLLKVCYQQDVPFTSLDVFAQHKLLQVARDHNIAMVVEPTGAEQLFSTSGAHLTQYLQDLLHKGSYTQFMDNYLGANETFSSKWRMLRTLLKEYVFKSSSDDLKETFIKASSEEFSYLKESFTDRYFKNLDERIKSAPTNINHLLMAEISGPKVKERLRTSDRNSVLAGVAVHHPFVSDKDLAEMMIKSNSVYKIRSGVTGSLLKRSMRGIWPEHVQKATKGNFNQTGDSNWLLEAREDLKELLTADLDDFVDSKKIKRDWDKLVLMADGSRNEFLWRVVNLAVWRHVYFG